MNHKYLLGAATLLMAASLLGAGCGSTDSSPSSPTPPPAPSTTTPPSSPSPVPTTPSSTPPSSTSTNSNPAPSGDLAITSSSTLDTTGWQRYENKTLKFTFLYPLRGRFAPEFSVKLLPTNSPDMENDCVKPSGLPDETQQHVTVNGTAFCRTMSSEGAAGSIYAQEVWATKNGNWYALITFVKRYANDPTKPFDVQGYHAHIESIMSTFQYPSGT